MIALVEPDWLKHDSVDDDSEPEQVDFRAKSDKTVQAVQRRTITTLSTQSISSILAQRPQVGQRSLPSYMPMVMAFMLGLGSTALVQLFMTLRRSR